APTEITTIIREGFQATLPAGDVSEAADRLVLVVDQFEELFTRCADEGARIAFMRAVCAAAAISADANESAALVLLSVRADFLGDCTAFPQLIPAARGALIVGPMTTGQLRAAIVQPAKAVGLELDPGLVEILLRDLHANPTVDTSATHDPGSLP